MLLALIKRLCLLMTLGLPGASLVSAAPRWDELVNPALGMPWSIGASTAGCIQGAVALPREGLGFRSMHRERRRFYGHPKLIQFVQEFARRVALRGIGTILVGDLGQPRGGPTPSGHHSHQNGLDVDIWFWLDPGVDMLSGARGAMPNAPSMLTASGLELDKRRWSTRQVELLYIASGFQEVDRIFVHPLIKQALCAKFSGESWLRKIRPWWGHDDHFHVRLHCPTDNRDCQSQDPLPEGDGCDATLEWWLSKPLKPPLQRRPHEVPLPAACQSLLRQ